MRLLVTGGAGFIGANFVQFALHADPQVQVTVLDSFTYAAAGENLAYLQAAGRLAPGLAPGQACARLEVVRGDIRDPAVVDDLIARQDAVMHLAAESHNDNSLVGPRIFVETNISGTFNVLDSATRHGVRLHHVSTDEVYGDLPLGTDQAFTEDSPYRPSSPYSATKAGSDHLVQSWIRSFGLAATISSCSNNYGPLQHVEKLIPRQVTNLIDGVRPRLYGAGENVRDWIHVQDHCAALWAILTRGTLGRTYLVGARAEHSNRAIIEKILTAWGRPADDFDLVADRPGHDLRYAINPGRIEAELGWAPAHTDLDAGLRETIEWYRANEAWWRPAKAATEAKYRSAGH